MDESQKPIEDNDEAKELQELSQEYDEIVEQNSTDVAKDEQPSVSVVEKSPEKPTQPQGGAGLIVLQWLTYAFWGWTLLFVLYLVALVFGGVLTSADLTGQIPYAMAGVLVLLPISFVCDLFYGKHEPVKKAGGSMVVMIIHAVIFALFGIGSLIGSVLIFVQMSVSTLTDFSGSLVWLFTLLVSSVLYALTFVRTLNPLPKLRITKWYKTAMLVVVSGFFIGAIAGPVAKSWTTRDDRDIASNLSSVSYGIENYVRKNKKLPESLNDVAMDPAGKSLVDRRLVTYKSDGVTTTSKLDSNYTSEDPEGEPNDFKYQLCVTYKTEIKTNLSPYYYTSREDSEYKTSLDIYGHPAGNVCYKLRTVQALPIEVGPGINTQKFNL